MKLEDKLQQAGRWLRRRALDVGVIGIALSSTLAAQPKIYTGGVVDAVYREELVEKNHIQIYGEGLADQLVVADTVPFPTMLGETQVLEDGVPLPLTVVSPGQVNAILLEGIHEHSIQVKNGDEVSDEYMITVGGEHNPGILTYHDDKGEHVAAIDENASRELGRAYIIGNNTPAKPGNAVTVFLTGLEQVAASGERTEGENRVLLDVLTGGTPLDSTRIYWSGLSPGLVAVGQVSIDTSDMYGRIPLQVRTNTGLPTEKTSNVGHLVIADPASALAYGSFFNTIPRASKQPIVHVEDEETRELVGTIPVHGEGLVVGEIKRTFAGRKGVAVLDGIIEGTRKYFDQRLPVAINDRMHIDGLLGMEYISWPEILVSFNPDATSNTIWFNTYQDLFSAGTTPFNNAMWYMTETHGREFMQLAWPEKHVRVDVTTDPRFIELFAGKVKNLNDDRYELFVESDSSTWNEKASGGILNMHSDTSSSSPNNLSTLESKIVMENGVPRLLYARYQINMLDTMVPYVMLKVLYHEITHILLADHTPGAADGAGGEYRTAMSPNGFYPPRPIDDMVDPREAATLLGKFRVPNGFRFNTIDWNVGVEETKGNIATVQFSRPTNVKFMEIAVPAEGRYGVALVRYETGNKFCSFVETTVAFDKQNLEAYVQNMEKHQGRQRLTVVANRVQYY